MKAFILPVLMLLAFPFMLFGMARWTEFAFSVFYP